MGTQHTLGLENFEAQLTFENDEIVAHFAGREVWRMHWADVDEIIIWRDESCSAGPLCFGLRTRNMKPGQYLGCNDATNGFDEALDEIDRHFENAYSRQWKDAVFPPMATQWMVIWGEPTGRAERAEVLWPEAA